MHRELPKLIRIVQAPIEFLSTLDFPSMSLVAYEKEPHEVIDGRWLDHRRLIKMLQNLYGPAEEGESNFRVEVNRTPFSLVHVLRR